MAKSQGLAIFIMCGLEEQKRCSFSVAEETSTEIVAERLLELLDEVKKVNK
jgi:hypothetical protein